jgi:hypothetical protein
MLMFLSTLPNCTAGTHDELLALNGLYSDLVSLQMQSAEDEPKGISRGNSYGINLEELATSKDEMSKSVATAMKIKSNQDQEDIIPAPTNATESKCLSSPFLS